MGAEMMFRLNSDYYEGEKSMTIPESMKFEDIEPFLETYKKDNPSKYPLAMYKSGIPGFTNFLESVVDNLIVYLMLPYCLWTKILFQTRICGRKFLKAIRNTAYGAKLTDLSMTGNARRI